VQVAGAILIAYNVGRALYDKHKEKRLKEEAVQQAHEAQNNKWAWDTVLGTT